MFFFECTGIINQAVSVAVTACRAVEVIPNNLHLQAYRVDQNQGIEASHSYYGNLQTAGYCHH